MNAQTTRGSPHNSRRLFTSVRMRRRLPLVASVGLWPALWLCPPASQRFPAVSPAATQANCAPQLRTADDYKSVFSGVGPVWTGGDGGGTIDLGDGRRLWLFGDTFNGPVDATKILPGWNFVHNSIAVEQHNCLTFKLGGTIADPTLVCGCQQRGPVGLVVAGLDRRRRRIRS